MALKNKQKKKKIVAVIPARYQSARLPGKPLVDIAGKSMIQRVYEQVQKAELLDEVIVATDDQRIFDHVKTFGQVEMTREDHKSGTDRIAELAHNHSDWSVVINVQGDEPFINPADINKAIEPFRYDPTLEMTSLYHDLFNWDEIKNSNNVKVVVDINDEAMFFSRSIMPAVRDVKDLSLGEVHVHRGDMSENEFMKLYLKSLHSEKKDSPYKKHIGLYGYTRDTLLALSHLEPTSLEAMEKLEQLRALENGIRIKMVKVDSAPLGIDTEADLKRAQELLSQTAEMT